MKKTSLFRLGIVVRFLLMLLCVSGINKSHAQIYIPAGSQPDNFLVNSRQWLNSADIDFTPNCSGPCGNDQLKVVSWAASGAGFIVDDGMGFPVTVSLPASASMPDVAIGNNMGTPSDYLVGVTYISGGAILLDIYDISNVGTGSPLSASSMGTYFVASITSLTGFPRIDIIADYGITFLGLPLCDKFVITYGDNGAIYGYASSLNNPSVSSSVPLTAPATFYYPDVAGIRRIVGSNIDDMGLFTYFDPSSNLLYYQEWDISSGAVSAPSVIDYANAMGKLPMIDAIDDYNINSPSGPFAYYNVVDRDIFGQTIRIYNNLLPINGMGVSTIFLPPGIPTGLPSVAVGPCTQYTIAWGTAFGMPDVLAVNIDWNTGMPVGYPGAVKFYEVNSNPTVNVPDQISVSSTCNNAGTSAPQYLLFNWNEGSSTDVYYKFADCSMALKLGNTASTAPVPAVEAQWSIAPNPATDIVTLSASNIAQGDKYTINDVAGRLITTAAITGGSQQIDVSSIAPGMYLINIYSNGQRAKTIKFVKQ